MLRMRHFRGIGLVELLLALSIIAMLLTATAAAVNASFTSYRINQENALLTQRARLTLQRMLTQIRCTTLHQPATYIDNFKSGQIVDDTGISLFLSDAPNAPQYNYYWDSSSQALLCKINDQAPRVLLHGVSAFVIRMEPMRSPQAIKTGGVCDLLYRATITLTIHSTADTAANSETTGQQTVTLSSSVVPRRNVWYGDHLPVPISAMP